MFISQKFEKEAYLLVLWEKIILHLKSMSRETVLCMKFSSTKIEFQRFYTVVVQLNVKLVYIEKFVHYNLESYDKIALFAEVYFGINNSDQIIFILKYNYHFTLS